MDYLLVVLCVNFVLERKPGSVRCATYAFCFLSGISRKEKVEHRALAYRLVFTPTAVVSYTRMSLDWDLKHCVCDDTSINGLLCIVTVI